MSRFAVLLCLLAAIGCADPSTGIVATCPPDSSLTYEGFGQLMIEEHCLECHAGNEAPRLDTIESVRTHARTIMHEAVETTKMPEGRGMTLEQREALGEWLACGAP